MQMSVDDLMAIIGNKEVDLIGLRIQLAAASARLQKVESLLTEEQKATLVEPPKG